MVFICGCTVVLLVVEVVVDRTLFLELLLLVGERGGEDDEVERIEALLEVLL